MHLFTGSPLALKKQFLKTLKEIKTNPFERVLVLLPSKHLENRLKKELCQNLDCLTGVDFMSLSALAREINETSPNPPPPLAEITPLLDFKIKNLLGKYHFKANRNLAICFKNSFRDLINAEITPDVLTEIQEDEDLVLEEQKIYLKQFIPLYSEFLELQKEEGKSTYKEFLVAARNNAKNNIFLESFKQIIFYGFYDLTSLQFELVKSVTENYRDKTIAFMPYEKKAAYTFAEPAYSSLFLPLFCEHTELKSENNLIKTAAENIFTPEQSSAVGADINIIKVEGEGEVQAAAKQILELHKNGVSYGDIALTFRGESGFNNKILEVFRQNKIPLNYSFSFPLLRKPFASFVYNLFNLDSGNFAREDVVSVLNSPFFEFRQEGFVGLIQQSGVECSINQFEEMISKDDPVLKAALIDVLREIKVHIKLIKQAGSFSGLAQKAKDFLFKYTSDTAQKEQAETLKQITDILNIISTYSTTGIEAKDGEFLEEFFALLKEAVYNMAVSAPDSVEVADIMALRLQDFKAVIIIGLNEGILPLVPAQDPALKEVYRQSLKKHLRNVLKRIGYLIHTRQNRYFEENLLFYFALSSAQEKAILTYKTSDCEGKHTVKSIFITLLLNVLKKKEEDLKNFSRRPFERLKNDIKQEFLTKEEASDLIALVRPETKELLANLITETEKEKESFETDYSNLKHLSSQGALTCFDGVINPEEAQKIYPKYFSPTALSNLFSCPAKYFFSRLIKEVKNISFRGQMADNEKGNLYHKILAEFYSLLRDKLPIISWNEEENLFRQFIKKFFNSPAQQSYGLYPLLWESIKEETEEILLSFIKKDFENMRKTGFFPSLFEVDKSANLCLDNKNFNLKATIDRIDRKSDSKEIVAIDYKKPAKADTIKTEIFTKNKLQPPLYLEILNKDLTEKICTAASFFYVEKFALKSLTLDDFNEIKNNFFAMLTFLHKLTLEGVFPITPDEKNSCKYCQFKDICRKNNMQTLRRAKKSEYFKKLRNYHYELAG